MVRDILRISDEDPRALAVLDAIRIGDVDSLRRIVRDEPRIAAARITGTGCDGESSRAMLHVVADWPGHFPDGATSVGILVDAGADVDARFEGRHHETPLHWAASSNDVSVLDALIDAGADIEASGAVIAGGTPLMDAVAFGQWAAARRLVERGAQTNLWQAAALGLLDRVRTILSDGSVDAAEIDSAFWASCHGGQLATAQFLADQGADPNFLPGWEPCTPLDAARRSEAFDVLTWLHTLRARSAAC